MSEPAPPHLCETVGAAQPRASPGLLGVWKVHEKTDRALDRDVVRYVSQDTAQDNRRDAEQNTEQDAGH